MEPKNYNGEIDFSDEIKKYLAYWKYYLISLAFFLFIAFAYLRYKSPSYKTTAKIEILDEAQDSEMALPTAMTIFNRSMINLENEVGILQSSRLNELVVKSINSNTRFYSQGNINTVERHKSDWFESYSFQLKADPENFKNKQEFILVFESDNKLKIIRKETESSSYYEQIFDNKSTLNSSHNFPFEIEIFDNLEPETTKLIVLEPISFTAQRHLKSLNIEAVGDSDHLSLQYTSSNIKNSEEYLNTLIKVFNQDGISDRQSEYFRTIEFVNARSEILKEDLSFYELKKENFKRENKVTEIATDASISIDQRIYYDSGLFDAKSQLELVLMLKETLLNNPKLELIPANLGFENISLNNIIDDYNKTVIDRNKFMVSSGANNPYLLNLEKLIIF